MATLTPAKVRNNRKWDQANMKKLQVNLRVETAEAFKAYARERGTSVHAILKRYIEHLLEEDRRSKGRP